MKLLLSFFFVAILMQAANATSNAFLESTPLRVLFNGVWDDYVYPTGNVSESFRQTLFGNVISRCHAYGVGSTSLYYPTNANKVFNSLGRGKDRLYDKILEVIDNNFHFEGSVYQDLIRPLLAWVVMTGIGIIIFVVAILATFCLCRCARKCCRVLTCGLCLRDRDRRMPKDVSKAKENLICLWLFLFGFFGLIVGVSICTLYSRTYRYGYLSATCDAEQTFQGALYGANITTWVDPSNPPDYQWHGVNYFYDTANYLDTVVLPADGTLLMQVSQVADDITNETTADAAQIGYLGGNFSLYLTDVQTRLDTVNVNHMCLVCQVASADINQIITDALTDVTTVRNTFVAELMSYFDESSSTITTSRQQALDTKEQLASVTQSMEENYNKYRDKIYKHSDKPLWWIYWTFLMFCLFGFLSFSITLITYVCLWLERHQDEPPRPALKSAFACNYVCLALFGASCIILGSTIFFTLSVTSGGCSVVEDKFLTNGQWADISGIDGDVLDVLNNCVTRNATGDFLLYANLTTEVADLEKEFMDAIDSVKNKTDTAIANLVDPILLDNLETAFSLLDFLFLPKDLSAAVGPVGPDYLLTSNLVYDYSLNCANVRAVMTTVPAICGGAVVTVDLKGLVTLNGHLNTNVANANWCIKQLESKNIVGCNAATPFFITRTTDVTDTVIQTEKTRQNTLVAGQGDMWLNYIRLAIAKEQLNFQEPFNCPVAGLPSPCSLPTFAPYVDNLNRTLSYFSSDLSAKTAEIRTAIDDAAISGSMQIDRIQGIVESDVLDPLKSVVNESNCTFLGDAASRLDNNICNITFPSMAMVAVAFYIFGICSLLIVPVSWKIYHYLWDLLHYEPPAKPGAAAHEPGYERGETGKDVAADVHLGAWA